MNKWLMLVIMIVCQGAYAADGEYSSANYEGKPDFRVMGCPAGSFWDPINGGECWRCPDGVRGVEAVDGPRACIVTPRARFSGATRLEANKNSCTGDSFLDVGRAECWTCPSGYKRTVFPVTDARACEKPIAKKKRKATYSYTVKSLLQSCKKGTFANVGSRKCYTCPNGWKHDPTKTVGTSGVCFVPATVDRDPATLVKKISLKCDSGFYDPIDGGSCWTCPSGFERQVTSVKSDSACVEISAPRATRAEKVTSLRPDPKKIAKGVAEIGCGSYGRNAFFDIRNGGSCWTCPSNYANRSLYAVDSPQACMTGTCGREGGRPCLLWERIPSCDAGLVEDFAANECRRPKDLSCKPMVQMLAAVHEAVEEATRRGEALSQSALEQIPGLQLVLQAAARKAAEMQAAVNEAMPELPLDEVLEPLQKLTDRNPELIERFVDVVDLARSQRAAVIGVLTDPELMCGGDLDRVAWRLNNLGFGDKMNPPPTYSIGVGSLGPQGTRIMEFAQAASPEPIVVAQNYDGLLRHHRVVFDFGATIPVKRFDTGAVEFEGSIGIAIQFATNFMPGGNHGRYITVAPTFSASAKDKFEDAGLAAKVLKRVSFLSVGFQYNGPTPDSCYSNDSVNAGIPVKITGVFSTGFRLRSVVPFRFQPFPCTLSGFSFSFPAVRYGAEPVPDPLNILRTPSPSGATTVGASHVPEKGPNRFKLDPGLKSGGFALEIGFTSAESTDNGAGIF